MVDYSNFTWKDNKLYLGSKYTGYQYAPEGSMFKILGPDGFVSDIYNLTRAKDNCVKMATSIANRIGEGATEKPAGAFLEGAM